MTKLQSKNPSLEGLTVIENKSFGEERALYNSKDVLLNNIKFEGKEDGESALKESSNIVVEKSKFDLRYPLWHVNHAQILYSTFTENSRAALWYAKDIDLTEVVIKGPKVFRESSHIEIKKSEIVSVEPFWRCAHNFIRESKIEGEYAFFQSKITYLENVTFKGKYSFQYNSNLVLRNCILDTKDAFWHSNQVYCENCVIKGEYIAWYAKNITFKDCTIESTQPFCYSKNVKLINCKMPNCDLAFEYSTVKADIVGKIDSIKNPISGYINADQIGNIILDNSKYKSRCKIKTRK